MTALSWSALVIGAALTLLLFAFVVRRLIGVRVPVPRTLAAGIVAVLVFSPIVTAMIGGPGFPRKGSALPALWFVILGAVIALLAGMVFLVSMALRPVHYIQAAEHRVGRMTLRLVQIAMNARDDSAVGRFWAEALGWSISSEEPGVTNVEPAGFSYPDPIAVCIDVIAVPEPKTVKNRVHVDLATTSAADQTDLVARLQDLGATPADVGQGDVSWTVLADPEGNEFCVLAPWPGGRDTGPVAAVTVDCADPRAMARFWDEAMDWTLHQVTDDHAVLRSATGAGPYLQFLRTPDMKTVKNRVHLDLRPYPGDDQAAEVARLRALGAIDIDLGQGDVPWTCLADPEGNEFDVLTPR